MFQRNIVITADGSHTVEIPELSVTYHSHHGAIQESRHVFIEAGLRSFLAAKPSIICILEVGFGTGLNALLTLAEAEKYDQKIQYTALEMYPLNAAEVATLNYCDELGFSDQFTEMHRVDWGKFEAISPTFDLLKLQSRIEHFEQPDAFDLIYFDAFSPVTQPDLWSETVMQHMFDALSMGGILTTYCAKGVVKRTLKSVGFEIESLPGPPGKREMTRASKSKN